MDVTGEWKQTVIDKLYKMENEGFEFDNNFKITSNGNDVTKQFMCKSLQGGWYRKYYSTEELHNKMN